MTITHVDERVGEQCDRCGEELWTRDGEGRYTLAMMFEGAPVLTSHTVLNCAGWSYS